MTEVSHFLKPEGWKITRADGVCTKMLAKKGTILIGRNETGNECFLVWMDGSKCLQIVRLQRQDKSSDWRGSFQHGGQDYWITVKGKGRTITGEIGPLDKKASRKPPTELSTTGTWGAEAGGGGGGGGTKGIPVPPEKGKAPGSGANVPS